MACINPTDPPNVHGGSSRSLSAGTLVTVRGTYLSPVPKAPCSSHAAATSRALRHIHIRSCGFTPMSHRAAQPLRPFDDSIVSAGLSSGDLGKRKS